MAEIFNLTDADGDRLVIDGFNHGPILTASHRRGDRMVSVELKPADVDRLLAALAPYGTQAAKAADAVPNVELVEGHEYRLLPDARSSLGKTEVRDPSRVRLRGADPDRDGDVYVESAQGSGDYVFPRFLAPLDEALAPAVELVVGREYKLLPGATTAGGGSVFFDDANVTRVRVLENDGRDAYAEAVDGDEAGLTQYLAPRFLAPLDEEPAPGVELVAGREYRVRQPATWCNGHRGTVAESRATRVVLQYADRDSDGDVYVRTVDGTRPGKGGCAIDPRFLAPLDEEPTDNHPCAGPRETLVRNAAALLVDLGVGFDAVDLLRTAEFLAD